ncbi:hypothetical protein [Reinekea marinisedimentorum]|uniref:Uncharacterized protein n=1 Tax=Reinekea marinisedimentorum TaxID=230495 RepID=A0A4R3ICC4_9GAMM|nr:hypothetical protein [Reinekea marinisedimentorum]TCS43275.1 hypothetical protein BCF53_102301 [Reinekea marinisedimentorum]
MNKILISFAPCLALGFVCAADSFNTSAYQGTGDVTFGLATTTNTRTFNCEQSSGRTAAMGEITGASGSVWTVPASNNFSTAQHAANLYDECSGNTPDSLSEVNLSNVPVVTIDDDGDEITGYIFADNYFELYINGVLVGVDAVPFTPFNSSVVKFKVSKPYDIAFKLIDWEENLGIGSEAGRGSRYSPGDGGIIASFSDGTVTGADWKAQAFYTAPIYDLSCLKETGTVRDSSGCSTKPASNANSYGIHWPQPMGWMNEGFDSSDWPQAVTYTEATIGVNNKNGYLNFVEKFTGAGAEFIWSSNLILDNLVLVHYRVE